MKSDWSKLRRLAVHRRVRMAAALARPEFKTPSDGARAYGASPTGPAVKVVDAATRAAIERALVERQRDEEWRAMWGKPLRDSNPEFKG